MSEKLERFIRNNRSEFDGYEPPAGLWDRIEKELDAQPAEKRRAERVIRLSVVLKVAAVVVLVFASGILVLNRGGQKAVDISRINPQLAEMQVKYASMIEERREEIRKVERTDPYLYSEFSSEIRKMDTNYQRLKGELPTSPNQEETVKAMIRNLQSQLDMLNQQLTIIQQINQIKKDKQQTNNGKQFI